MKKIALVLVAAMVLVFTGCEKKETISMPFDVADVNNIEMYRNVVPNSAEKQVITKTDDIEDIYFLFSGLEVSDKKTEPVAGGTVTSFRFNLSNDTSYEIIYCAEAVKSGRLKLPEEKLDYFTAADIESYWDNYQYEIVPVSENELPGQEETQEWDKIPMVVPFPVSWTVKMKKKQKETQDILSYHTQAAGCSDKARAKASGGRQPIEECGRTGL